MTDQPLDIWLLQTGEQLPVESESRRLRTRLLADELAGRGHRVTWWASTFNHMRKEACFTGDTTFSPYAGLTITAIHGIGYGRNMSLRRLVHHRITTRKFRKAVAQASSPDVIVASYPPHDLAEAAVAFARQRRIPVVVDIRDKWPDIFEDTLPRALRPIGHWVLIDDYARRNRAMTGADALVSMTEPLLDWGLSHAGRTRGNQDRVFYLGSYREAQPTPSPELAKIIATRLKGRVVITFMGQFASSSDPSVAIDVAARMVDDPRLVFVLAGDGDLGPSLREKAHDLPNVVFTGWLESEGIAALLHNSSLGLATTGRRGELNFLPNKVFNYLSAGVPVASMFHGELQHLIDHNGFGFNFSNSDELLTRLSAFANSPDQRISMAARAREFFDQQGDAGTIYACYADFVEDLAKSGNGPRTIPNNGGSN